MGSLLLSFGSMLEGTKRYFANFSGTTNCCRTIALWVTLALVLAFVITKVELYLLGRFSKTLDKDSVKKANGLANLTWLTVAVVYAFALIITFTACYFVEVKTGEDYLVPITYYPMLVFILVTFASVLAVVLKPIKPVKITAVSLTGAALLAVIICLIVYSATGGAEEWNYITLAVGQNVGLYISSLLLVAGIAVFAFFSDRKSKPWDSRSLSFAAVCIALSFALSYVRIFKMPMGGSITFASLLPIMLFSYMFGTRKGVLAGVVYGILQAVQDPWILHPAQFLLDYPVAFAAIGLTGCLKGFKVLDNNVRAQFTLGALIAGALRFISHFFSGAFAFGSYGASYAEEFSMPALANEYVYSLVYQSLYVIPELIIVIVVGVILLSSKNFVKTVNRYSLAEKAKPAAVQEAAPQNTEQPAESNN